MIGAHLTLVFRGRARLGELTADDFAEVLAVADRLRPVLEQLHSPTEPAAAPQPVAKLQVRTKPTNPVRRVQYDDQPWGLITDTLMGDVIGRNASTLCAERQKRGYAPAYRDGGRRDQWNRLLAAWGTECTLRWFDAHADPRQRALRQDLVDAIGRMDAKADPAPEPDPEPPPAERDLNVTETAIVSHAEVTPGPMPRTRAECISGPRPCPWTECRHHLRTPASAKRGPAGHVVTDHTESCALDVADRGSSKLEDVGRLMGVTPERVRQIEAKALERMRQYGVLLGEGL